MSAIEPGDRVRVRSSGDERLGLAAGREGVLVSLAGERHQPALVRFEEWEGALYAFSLDDLEAAAP